MLNNLLALGPGPYRMPTGSRPKPQAAWKVTSGGDWEGHILVIIIPPQITYWQNANISKLTENTNMLMFSRYSVYRCEFRAQTFT